MSIELKRIYFCHLVKNEQDELIVEDYSTEAPINAGTESIAESIHNAFNNKKHGFGVFKNDSLFKEILDDELKVDDFSSFSYVLSRELRSELSKYPFADTGVLMFARYEILATEYLMVAIIPKAQGVELNNEPSVSSIHYLDIKSITIAARINLTDYQHGENSNRYIQFLKGRIGRRVGDFFLDFLEADIGFDAKTQSQVLMQAVSDYCSDAKLDKEETLIYRKQVHNYCNDQLKAGEEVEVRELSNELADIGHDHNFEQFTKEQGYEIEDSFPADKPTIRKLTRFVGAGGGLSINFDCMLLGERIFYDPETDILTIKGIPPNLKDQLNR